MRPLAEGLNTSTHAPWLAASLWFEYVRLLGTPTVLSIAAATLLHGCYCELASEPIHWGTAGLIVMISLVMSVAFWRGPHTLGWTGAGIVLMAAWLLNMRGSVTCEVHQGFLAALSGMCVGSALASAVSRAPCGLLKMTSHDGTPATTEEAQPMVEAANTADDLLPSPSLDGERPNEDRKTAWGKRWTFGLLLGIFLVYMIVVPVVAMVWEMWTPRPTMRRELTEMSLDEYFRLHTVSGVIMTMFLAMGASVGSFLNVVIFRLPRGRALLWPPSACAACGTRIAGRDNIPIFAWLNLSGKCRHCGAALSVRYPLVEAIVAALFVLFFYRELLSGGENLPVRTSNVYRGIVWILFYTKWDLLTLYVFHMFVLTCVFSWAMINLDSFRVPKFSLLICLASVVLLVALAPHLNPLLATGPKAGSRLSALVGSLVGLGVGGLFGMLLAQLFKLGGGQVDLPVAQGPEEAAGIPEQQQEALEATASEGPGSDVYGSRALVPASTSDAAGAMALLGAAMGYQAVVSIGLVTAVITLGLWLLRRTGVPWRTLQVTHSMPITLILFGVAVVHLAFWNSIHIVRFG